MHKFIVTLFALVLCVSSFARADDVQLPIPCERNPQESNACNIGMGSCAEVSTQFKSMLEQNIQKMIGFHRQGFDVNIASSEVPTPKKTYPKTIDLFDRTKLNELKSNAAQCPTATVTRNGSVDARNACAEARLFASVDDKALLCQLDSMMSEIEAGTIAIRNPACQELARDAIKLSKQAEQSGAQKVFLASINKETSPFCAQKGNKKNPTEVPKLCERAGALSESGSYDGEVAQNLQLGCALMNAIVAHRSAVMYTLSCELLARWDAERQQVTVGSNSDLARYLNSTLGSEIRSAARRAGRKYARRGRRSRAIAAATNAGNDAYKNIYEKTAEFTRSKYYSCSQEGGSR